MKKILLLYAGWMISAATTFGQSLPQIKVTERDMNGVVFKYVEGNQTVVEVKSNVRLEFESTMDKSVNVYRTYEKGGFFFYELLFPTVYDNKPITGRKLKIQSYGFDTHIQPLELKAKNPVGLLVINETKSMADNFFNQGKYAEALKGYEKLFGINPKDEFVKHRIEACNAQLGIGGVEIQGRKVSIQRFSNETAYARGIFYDEENDPIGKQALAILSTHLAKTNQFTLLEWNENREGWQLSDYQKLGVNYLITGSITNFGRKNEVVKRQKVQIVQASVSIRLIDVQKGQILYTEEARGEAKSKSKSYDSTLEDKAITDAVSKLVVNIVKHFNL
ncbi:MAG: hypothetical protein LBB41_04165 [Prevotellaceae bacterium]|jgi:hypothetical protein|nr:hypothetical protein [Prevotellaceae bacterium]